MKKLNVLLILSLLLSSMILPVGTIKAAPAGMITQDLMAGQHYKVGVVEVWNTEEYLYVRYIIDQIEYPGVYLTETHVAVETDPTDMPLTKKFSPKIGKFEYSADHNYLTEVLVEIPLEWNPGDLVYIAAHAVVKSMPLGMGPCPGLPSMVTVDLEYDHSLDSYFLTTISGGTILDGTYAGWCIDADNGYNKDSFNAYVYCSYDPNLPVGIVEYPGNLDLVNYMLNKDYSGMGYTWGDIQMAIWELLDDNLPPVPASDLPPHTPENVDEIIDDALLNGEGYTPECGDYVAIILVPDDGTQMSIIKIRVPCGFDETAWAQGEYFRELYDPDRQADWSMYFDYTIYGEVD